MGKTTTVGLALVFLAVLVLALPASAQDGSQLDGAYEFTYMETPDGIQETQTGMLVVNAGHLCHLRTQKEREQLNQQDSQEESTRKAAALFRSINGTCGEFTIVDNKIQATWQSAVNPASVGNTTEFIFEMSGDLLKIAPAAAPQFKFVYRRR